MAENNILENNQKDILGHQSVIQTRAYAKHAKKKMIPIDIQAKQNNLACNVIQANKAA